MKEAPSYWRSFASIAMIVLLAGCGGGGSETGSDATATPVVEPARAETTTSTPAPTAAANATPELSPTLPPNPDPTSIPTPPQTATPIPPRDFVVNVYWAWTIPTTPGGSPERLGAGGREVTTTGPARAAIEALLSGPNALELEIGMGTLIPPDTRLLGITIRDGIAVIDLSSEFEQGSGSLAEFARVAQVVFTLTQFDTVDAVSFRINGEDREALASHGIDVSRPLDRDDFEGVRPNILLERPYPGAAFASTDRLIGEARVFEGTVEYVATNPSGLIIADGFTTANIGDSAWGRFNVSVVLDSEAAGRGAVIVFETSAEDGTQVNVVEYPIRLIGS